MLGVLWCGVNSDIPWHTVSLTQMFYGLSLGFIFNITKFLIRAGAYAKTPAVNTAAMEMFPVFQRLGALIGLTVSSFIVGFAFKPLLNEVDPLMDVSQAFTYVWWAMETFAVVGAIGAIASGSLCSDDFQIEDEPPRDAVDVNAGGLE